MIQSELSGLMKCNDCKAIKIGLIFNFLKPLRDLDNLLIWSFIKKNIKFLPKKYSESSSIDLKVNY